MARLSPEQNEYAVAMLEKLVRMRDISQTWLEEHSGIPQPEISRFLRKQKTPTKEDMEKLFEALGIRLTDVIHSTESLPDTLLAYVATPLTGIANDKAKDGALRAFVQRIDAMAQTQKFSKPGIRFYWPGNHTHPVDHKDVSARQVYITDRSRASSYDLLVMLCVEPSYGVGQENEIATQAGVPAIRLLPEKGISRMMTGSFLHSWNIPYAGSLETKITFDEQRFIVALGDIRKLYFAQKALYGGVATFDFGPRLEELVNDRIGSKTDFAAKIGISPDYVDVLFVEPLVVSNPGSVLLLRMAKVLSVSVAYLLGESTADDTVFTASMSSLNKWVTETPGLDAQTIFSMRDTWTEQYYLNRQPSLQSQRNGQKPMTKADWNALYMQPNGKGIHAKPGNTLF